jgi:hypothetical protein
VTTDKQLQLQSPSFDMYMPLPSEGMRLDPCTILTYYFGFSVPEAKIGAFIYGRNQPAFPLSQGGVCIFRGTENIDFLDMAYSDYSNTMVWPEVGTNHIQYTNGLRIEFLEPGKRARLTYSSKDGGTSFDLVQTAVTPLLARGHVVPGEDLHRDSKLLTGGLEQMMRCTGKLVLNGERYDVDCFNARDRSWGQVRPEGKRAVAAPPVGWSPMYFGEDYMFNQVSFEALDTNPPWKSLYAIPDTAPTFHFAWIIVDGEMRSIKSVHRHVTRHHPILCAAMEQTIRAVDETGRIHTFRGEAVAMSNMPSWPNAALRVGVYKWTDEAGRVAHDTYQEMWLDDGPHKLMREALKNSSWT